MGAYLTEVRLRQQLLQLDAALARGDRLAANLATAEINRLRAVLAPRPAKDDELVQKLPRWIRKIVKNKGIRVQALERAFDADKVVLTGFSTSIEQVGGPADTAYGVQLKINF